MAWWGLRGLILQGGKGSKGGERREEMEGDKEQCSEEQEVCERGRKGKV